MSDHIDQLLSQVPDTYTYSRRSRKDGSPSITILAKKRDPDTDLKERFEVSGPADLVREALAFWIELRTKKTENTGDLV